MASESSTAKFNALKLVKWLSIGLALMLVLMMVSLWWLLGTESGRLLAVDRALGILNRSESLNVQVEGLQYPTLSDIEFTSLKINRNSQLWIDANDFQLRWKPFDLLQTKLTVERVYFSELQLFQTHGEQDTEISAETEASDKSLNLDTLNIPEVQIAEFAIDRIRLPSPTGTANDTNDTSGTSDNKSVDIPDIQISGSLLWLESSPFELRFDATLIGEIPTTISLNATEGQTGLNLIAAIDEGPGGSAGGLIRLPVTQPLNADLVTQVSRLDRDFNLSIERFEIPVGTRELGALGNLGVSQDLSQVVLSDFLFTVDDTEHHIEGRLNNDVLELSLRLNAFPLGLLTDFDLLRYEESVVKDGTIDAQISLTGSPQNPNFDAIASIDTQLNNQPLIVSFEGNGNANEVSVEKLELAWASAALSANGDLDLETDNSQFTVQLTELDMTRLREFGLNIPDGVEAMLESANGEISGSMRDPNATISANIVGSYDGQPFELNANAQKTLRQVNVDSASMSFRDSQTLASGEVDLDTLIGEFNINIEPFSIEMLEMTGITLPSGLQGNLEGSASVSGDMNNPQVRANLGLAGSYKDIPYRARADLSRIDQVIDIRSINISARERDILDIQGQIDEENIDIHLIADQLPTELLSAAGLDIEPGDFSADFSLQGPMMLPNIVGFLEYKTESQSADATGVLAASQFEWRLEADTIMTDASDETTNTDNETYSFQSLFSTGGSPSGELKIQLPAKPYMALINSDNRTDMGDLPLNIALDGDFDLSILSLFADPDIHRASGNLRADLIVQGTLASPSVLGNVGFQNTDYDNPITGTHIEKLNCTLIADDDRFEFGECVASDGNSGSFDISGSLALPLRGSSGDIDIEMKVNQAHILQRPEIESQATGSIQLEGDFQSLLAKGSIEVAPLEASIETNTSSGIPKIRVEKVESLEGYNSEAVNTSETSPLITLDLLVTASQQAYIRGRGLEAELQGEIYLRGTAQKPRYEGEFSTIRGEFEVFGKTFELENGLVNFANNAIGLNFEGVYEEDEQSVTALITGTVEDLDISFTASPSMAEDEILAFIIFGKSVQEMTPFEAIQLASAVQQLRGGGGFDPIGAARDALGIDRLSIESETLEDDSTGVNVGIGKYLNEKVYLEIERTPNPSQPWKGNLEIELTPRLNLESSTGGSTGIEGAELKWKKDY